MKNVIVMMVILIISLTIGLTQATIIIDGNTFSGDVLNIVDSTYKDSIIRVTGDSVVDIFYNDGIGWDDWYFDHHSFPAVKCNIIAEGSAKINLYTFFLDVFDFYLVDTSPQENWVKLYQGIEVQSCSYGLETTDMYFLRDYKLALSFDKSIGTIELRDNSALNFVPEPLSILFLGIGVIFLRKNNLPVQ
jgi:hypothetical protein